MQTSTQSLPGNTHLNPIAHRLACWFQNGSSFLHTIAAVSVVFYIFVFTNLPTFLFPAAGHDDGLFIFHAHSIVEGHWLGRFNQYTLMKGPGYPLFLAALSLFRISPPFAHAAFYGLAVWLLSYATYRIFGSRLLAVAVLEMLLWNFGPLPMRVIRDAVTLSQFLSTLALLALALFVVERSKVTRYSCFAGLMFGWFWMTREDGIIAVPTLLLVFAAAIHKSYQSQRSLRPQLKVIVPFLASFLLILGFVSSLNAMAYKEFGIVDIKGPFELAFEALSSVKPAVYVDHEAVPRSAREQVYKVSPAFAELRPLLESDQPQLKGWRTASCGVYAQVCGDYSTGFFMWALRDAVALDGKYATAPSAEGFYHAVYREISQACESKALTCQHNPLPFAPHLSFSDLHHAGDLYKDAFRKLSFVEAPFEGDLPSVGTDDQILGSAQFLNLTYHTAPPARTETLESKKVERFAFRIRHNANKIYAALLPSLLLLGFLSALALAVRYILTRNYPVSFALVCGAWVAVLARITALVMVDIAAFPSIFSLYIGYAFPLACYAALTSIYLLAVSLIRTSSKQEEPVATADLGVVSSL